MFFGMVISNWNVFDSKTENHELDGHFAVPDFKIIVNFWSISETMCWIWMYGFHLQTIGYICKWSWN